MNVGDTVGYKEHRGIVIGFAAKDHAAQVVWYTPKCLLSVHWPMENLELIEKGPRSIGTGLEKTVEQAEIDRLNEELRKNDG